MNFLIIRSDPLENNHLPKIQETRLHINTIQLLPKRELKISELSINNENLYKISNVAREWQCISSQNRLKCESASYQKFEDSRRISMLTAECMEQPNETAQIWNRILICKDAAQDEIQAIALVFAQQNQPQLKIAHLVTHPRNIRSNINKNEWTRVEGAGRAIIDYLAAIISNDQEIYVESVESAKLFYIKQGFEELDSQEQRPFEFGTTRMRLTKQKFTILSDENNF